jgi:hypothetical protein
VKNVPKVEFTDVQHILGTQSPSQKEKLFLLAIGVVDMEQFGF